MITTKMNPARTWTEEGSVGLGGAYMCIYPMYSPGGYQLVGRTLPLWNTWGKHQPRIFSRDKPWMLEMFDQIRFFPCEEQELNQLREQFRVGTYVPEITFEDFHLAEHTAFLDSIQSEVDAYKLQQKNAMDIMREQERLSLERLCDTAPLVDLSASDTVLPKGHVGVEAVTSGNVWEIAVRVGGSVSEGDVLFVLEAMKMQIPVPSPVDGVVAEIRAIVGQIATAGRIIVTIAPFDVAEILKVPSPSRARRAKVSSLQFAALQRSYGEGGVTVYDVVDHIFDAIAQRDRDHGKENYGNIWISPAPRNEVHHAVRALRDHSLATSPLYGIPFVVKDNIDVTGYVTTAGCPGYNTEKAVRNAPCVQKLLDAGAIFMGKTNLDQFAMGLVGTRSPYGECYNSFHPHYVSGGSSSGSAVAVSLGFASFSLGTDTAGSGRVPAAFNNIVGLKPSCGLVSTTGVVPACRSLDCVSIFALTARDADVALKAMQGVDLDDCFSRPRVVAPLPSGPLRIGIPHPDQLRFFGNEKQGHLVFNECIRLLQKKLQMEVESIDFERIAPFSLATRPYLRKYLTYRGCPEK